MVTGSRPVWVICRRDREFTACIAARTTRCRTRCRCGELIYTGEAADVRDRVSGHNKWSAWRAQLKSGEVLCFNAALIAGESDRQRAEAAMIFKHKPRWQHDLCRCVPVRCNDGLDLRQERADAKLVHSPEDRDCRRQRSPALLAGGDRRLDGDVAVSPSTLLPGPPSCRADRVGRIVTGSATKQSARPGRA
jgi:hypothetical protein